MMTLNRALMVLFQCWIWSRCLQKLCLVVLTLLRLSLGFYYLGIVSLVVSSTDHMADAGIAYGEEVCYFEIPLDQRRGQRLLDIIAKTSN